jgi:uncharacterized protein DUF6221
MDELIAFLNERLDEEESTVRRAGESRIAWLTYLNVNGTMHYTTVADGHAGVWIADGHELPEPASVLVMFETARALRDIEADRKLLSRYACVKELRLVNYTLGYREALEEAIRFRAARFSSHPGYPRERS